MSTPAIDRGSRPSFSLAQIAFGVLLVLFGLGWLLDSTGVWHISWGAALPIALIAVGALLVLGSATPRHGGLVALGVVLTVVLAVTTTLNVPIGDRVGTFVDRPAAIGQVQREYRVALGDQTLDLRDVAFPSGTTAIKASTAVGQLVVNVPADVGVTIHFAVGVGNATILGQAYSWNNVDETYTSDNYASATTKLQLDLAVGVGNIEVRR